MLLSLLRNFFLLACPSPTDPSFFTQPTEISPDRKMCFKNKKVFKKFSRPTDRDFARPKNVFLKSRKFSRPTKILCEKLEEKKKKKNPDRPTDPFLKMCGGQANNLSFFSLTALILGWAYDWWCPSPLHLHAA